MTTDTMRALNHAPSIVPSDDPPSVMQTLTGIAFDPFNPKIHDISIYDIAGALSKVCRYAGHCLQFYSVAEHSVHVARKAQRNQRLTALMHDSPETYFGDMIRPVKRHLPNYIAIENRLMERISSKFGLIFPIPDEVKFLDNSILTDEREQNMAPMSIGSEAWGAPYPALGVKLQFWGPQQAEQEFLLAFREYGGKA